MRSSDWSSDVCSSDLPSAPNRVRSGPSRRQSPPRWRHLYVAPTPRPPKAEMARAVLYQPVWLNVTLIMIRIHTIFPRAPRPRSEAHTSELQSLMRISYAVFCLNKKIKEHKAFEYTLHNSVFAADDLHNNNQQHDCYDQTSI